MLKVRHELSAPTRTLRLASGDEIPAHRHDDHQIVYAGRGVLAVTTDRGSWIAPATRAIWIPAGTFHAHRAYGELKLHTVGLAEADNPLELESPTVLTVAPLLRELIIAYTGSDADAPERTRLRAVLLDQLRSSPQQPHHVPSPTAPLLAAVCDIMHADPGDGRTLAELGRVVGASDRSLSRLFRQDLGMTFPQWRTQLRLHRALVLLAERTPVTTVAHQCGWSSASAFIEVFRRSFGHTPGTSTRLDITEPGWALKLSDSGGPPPQADTCHVDMDIAEPRQAEAFPHLVRTNRVVDVADVNEPERQRRQAVAAGEHPAGPQDAERLDEEPVLQPIGGDVMQHRETHHGAESFVGQAGIAAVTMQDACSVAVQLLQPLGHGLVHLDSGDRAGPVDECAQRCSVTGTDFEGLVA